MISIPHVGAYPDLVLEALLRNRLTLISLPVEMSTMGNVYLEHVMMVIRLGIRWVWDLCWVFVG